MIPLFEDHWGKQTTPASLEGCLCLCAAGHVHAAREGGIDPRYTGLHTAADTTSRGAQGQEAQEETCRDRKKYSGRHRHYPLRVTITVALLSVPPLAGPQTVWGQQRRGKEALCWRTWRWGWIEGVNRSLAMSEWQGGQEGGTQWWTGLDVRWEYGEESGATIATTACISYC